MNTKVEKIIVSLCDLIEDLTTKCQTAKDSFTLADVMKARMIMDEYLERYGTDTAEESWNTNRIKSEIQAAETYYNKWIETNDEKFKIMSEDELEHAGIIMENAGATIPSEQLSIFKKQIDSIKINLNKSSTLQVSDKR